MSQGWIGVDLDGTLAEHRGGHWDGSIGAPVPAMVERVKAWLKAGLDVRIFTARAANPNTRLAVTTEVQKWCTQHLGKAIPVTNAKDFDTIAIYDDRAVQVELNTGRLISDAEAR